jgi:LPS sulfotransferase NodH
MQPHTSYLVCGTPRSGSSLLCEALTNTGIAGRPEEYFQPANEIIWKERWGISTYVEYLAHTIKQCTTPNGVFGAKMMWGYFDHFLQHLYQMPDYKKRRMPVHTMLQAIFPNLHYIWIRRRHILRQAVSQAKAIQTNRWVDRGESSGMAACKPEFSFMQIDFLVQEIKAHNAAWRRFFAEHHIQPLVIVYEDFVVRYEETVREALQHLGIADAEALEVTPVSMKKQADEQSEQWVLRYLQLKSQARYRLVSQANSYLLSFLRGIRPGASIARKRTV